MPWGSPKTTNTRDEMRKHKRQLQRGQRELDKDFQKLERQEKQLEADIKAAAKRGNNSMAKTLAKQLVTLRKHKERNVSAKSKMAGIGAQAVTMQSTAAMAKSMGSATKVMSAMNAQVSLPELQKTMQNFEKETAKMGMTEEMMDDALDSIFESDEEEENLVIDQILDEIGVDVKSQLQTASAPKSKLPQRVSNADEEADIMARLQALGIE